MRTPSSATSAGYEEQFNKQLSEQLLRIRQAQPNHIPVYAMKYKNASKYFVQDLQEPLALFPKKYKLTSIHELIQKQSLKFCHEKLQDDKNIKQQGLNFKLPNFFIYTISMSRPDQNYDQNKKEQPHKSSKKPIGTFVKLNLEMTFQQAFEKYGRQNVLTIVYTDAGQVNRQYNKIAVTTVQKWLTRIIILILILVLIPFLMKGDEQKFESRTNLQTKHRPNQTQETLPNERIGLEDTLDLQKTMRIDMGESESIYISSGRTFEYDEDSI